MHISDPLMNRVLVEKGVAWLTSEETIVEASFESIGTGTWLSGILDRRTCHLLAGIHRYTRLDTYVEQGSSVSDGNKGRLWS